MTIYTNHTKSKLDQYKICVNRHYKTLEGKQAKKYRQKFSNIASIISPTIFYIYVNGTIQIYDQLMSVIGKSDCWIEEKECEKAKELLVELDKRWTHTRAMVGVANSLGKKYHYLSHCVDYMTLWRLGIGYINEQSIESFHKTCSMVIRRYRNQRGLLRSNTQSIKYS